MIKKITSENNLVFLFKDIPNEQRNSFGIASGESVLLSIYENDMFYFTTDINLIRYDSIVKIEDASPLEIEFFNLLKDVKQIKYTVGLIKEYDIYKYIHFLPRVKYSQYSKDREIVIRGDISFKETIYPNEIPKILLDDELEIELIDDTYFEYVVSEDLVGEKIQFKLDLPKQTVSRAYKVKPIS